MLDQMEYNEMRMRMRMIAEIKIEYNDRFIIMFGTLKNENGMDIPFRFYI